MSKLNCFSLSLNWYFFGHCLSIFFFVDFFSSLSSSLSRYALLVLAMWKSKLRVSMTIFIRIRAQNIKKLRTKKAPTNIKHENMKGWELKRHRHISCKQGSIRAVRNKYTGIALNNSRPSHELGIAISVHEYFRHPFRSIFEIKYSSSCGLVLSRFSYEQ